MAMFWIMLFTVALLVGTALSVYCRCPLLIRSAAVLMANQVLCWVVALSEGSISPSLHYLVIDAVSAWVLLWHPRGLTQARIGIVFAVQLGLHFCQWASGFDPQLYVRFLYIGGGMQIAFLISGAINGDGRTVRRGRRRRGHNHVDLGGVPARIAIGGGQ